MVGGGSFKIWLSRKCCAARIRSLKGGTGFPGVNLAHDGNEFRLVETVYIRIIPYQSSMNRDFSLKRFLSLSHCIYWIFIFRVEVVVLDQAEQLSKV